jgi:hypothetical protein
LVRDEVAKERRLRRFNDRINQNEKAPHQPEYENLPDKSKDGSRFSIPEKGEAVLDQMVEMDEADGLAEKDWQSAEPVLGVCPDMCAGTINTNLNLMLFLATLDSRNCRLKFTRVLSCRVGAS